MNKNIRTKVIPFCIGSLSLFFILIGDYRNNIFLAIIGIWFLFIPQFFKNLEVKKE